LGSEVSEYKFLSNNLCILYVSVVAVVPSLFRDLSKLSFMGIVSLSSMLYITIVLAVQFFIRVDNHSLDLQDIK